MTTNPHLPEQIDLGGGHSYIRSYDESGHWIGITHRSPDGCLGGVILFDIPETKGKYGSGPRATVTEWDPLTLPQLIKDTQHRKTHSHLGYITAGVWVEEE